MSGTVTARGQRYAEAGYYVLGGSVVLLRSSLHDSLRSIHLVRRRLVIAGLIALVASLLVGYLAATLFARRIRRLERAADRIADGDFSEPVADRARTSSDSWPRPSRGCASAWPSSSTRGGSSSRTRRTSSERRSSRSAASSR